MINNGNSHDRHETDIDLFKKQKGKQRESSAFVVGKYLVC